MHADDIQAVLEFAARESDHVIPRVACMRFLVEPQLPPALARWLVERGHEAEHVADFGFAAASDDAI